LNKSVPLLLHRYFFCQILLLFYFNQINIIFGEGGGFNNSIFEKIYNLSNNNFCFSYI